MGIGKYSGSHTAISRAVKRSKGNVVGEHTAYKQKAFKQPEFKLNKKHIIILSVALAAVLVIVLSVLLIRTDRQNYEAYMAEAADSYAAEDYEKALIYLRKAVAIDKNDDILLFMADCYEAQGNLDKAIGVLKKSDGDSRIVERRITALEKERKEALALDKKSVAGQKYDAKSRALNLDGAKLDDSSLEEISRLTNLEKLSLANNFIKDVSRLSNLSALASLNLSGNNVEDISPLAALGGLKSLYLDENPVKELTAVLQLKNLKLLSLKGINISSEQLTKLSEALPECTILTGEPDGEIVTVSIAGLSFTSDAEELDLSGRGISNIGAISFCPHLKKLDISGNKVNDLYDIMNLPELTELNVSDNQICDLRPLMGLKNLESLDASDNNIAATTALGSIDSLMTVKLSGNPLGDFSGLLKLPNLRYLEVKNTGLKDETLEQFKGFKTLVGLSLEDNPELSGEAVDELKLKLTNCVIKNSELAYSVRLGKEIVMANTKELKLSACNVSDLSPLGQMAFLEHIDLSVNNISDLSPFSTCPGREKITELNLASNSISNVSSLAELKNLENLNLAGNNISSVMTIMSMSRLKTLDLSGNPLTDEQIKNLRESLPGCTVIFE